jgi:hypothetical protein
MSVFDVRNFNEDEKNAIKQIVDDTVECMNQIKDLQEHMKENHKGLADRLNENTVDDEAKVKPALFAKMAKAYIKNKEDIEKSKNDLDEVETALQVVYKM